MRALRRELGYALTMPGLLVLTYADKRWPTVVAAWDAFWDEVANVRQSRHH